MRTRSLLLWRGRVHIRRLPSQRLLAFGFNKLFYCLKRRRLFELFAIPSDRCAAVGSYGDAVIRVFFCSSATADTRFPIQEGVWALESRASVHGAAGASANPHRLWVCCYCFCCSFFPTQLQSKVCQQLPAQASELPASRTALFHVSSSMC